MRMDRPLGDQQSTGKANEAEDPNGASGRIAAGDGTDETGGS